MGTALRLKELREDRGLSQRQLADTLGVASGTVARWEIGTRIPSMASLLALVNFFGCTIQDLVIPVEDAS